MLSVLKKDFHCQYQRLKQPTDEMPKFPYILRSNHTGSFTPEQEPEVERDPAEVDSRDVNLIPCSTKSGSNNLKLPPAYDADNYQVVLTSSKDERRTSNIIDYRQLPVKQRSSNKVVTFIVTNVFVSMFLLLFGVGVSVGLGAYTLFSVSPSLVIDKSVKAFTIPNHEVSRQYDALETAKNDFRDFLKNGESRGKRDVKRDVISDSLLHVIDKNDVVHQMTRDQYVASIEPELRNVFYGEEPGVEDQMDMPHLFHDQMHVSPVEHGQMHVPSVEHDQRPPAGRSSDHHRQKRQTTDYPRRPGTTQATRKWKMQLVYVAQGHEDKDNVFTPDRIEAIQDIEWIVRNHTGYTDFCYIDYSMINVDPNLKQVNGCAPMNTLMTYFYPSYVGGKVMFDALGQKQEDITVMLRYAMQYDTFYWYVDDRMSPSFKRSRFLRTEVHFGGPLPGYSSSSDRSGEQYDKFKDFIITYIDVLSKASNSKIQVLYGGNELFDYEVGRTFWNDIKMAGISLGAIFIIMLVLTSFSPWLTFWGLTTILLSFPLAVFFYRVVFDTVRLGILNGAAAFVIIGIGVDDVFVFMNTFRQSSQTLCLEHRLLHTLQTAGKATFFTSFTTAAAFAANVASSIPAIHDFGLFMALVVSSCWIMVMVMMIPTLNLWHKLFSRCEAAMYKCCPSCTSFGSGLQIPKNIFFTGHTNQPQERRFSYSYPGLSYPGFSNPGYPGSTSSASNISAGDLDNFGLDDDARFDIQHKASAHGGSGIICLGMLEEILEKPDEQGLVLVLDDNSSMGSPQEVTSEEDNRTEGCGLTTWLQAAMYHFIVLPTIKARHIILVVFVVVLACSMASMTQVKTASKPPQLFQPHTNLQQLWDLAANMTDSGITCDQCSGFYKTDDIPSNPPSNDEYDDGNNGNNGDNGNGDNGGNDGNNGGNGNGPATPPSTTPKTTKATTPKARSTTAKTSPGRSTTPRQTDPRPTNPPDDNNNGNDNGNDNNGGNNNNKDDVTTRVPVVPDDNNPGGTRDATTVAPGSGGDVTQDGAGDGGDGGHGDRPTQAAPGVDDTLTNPGQEPDGLSTAPSLVTEPSGTTVPGLNPCGEGMTCKDPVEPPALDQGASIHVVFGIEDINRDGIAIQHVLTDKGEVHYAEEFQSALNKTNINTVMPVLRDLCKICWIIANNTQLVIPNGGQCVSDMIPIHMRQAMRRIRECRNLPTNKVINGKSLPSHAMAGYNQHGLQWLAFSFESTTYKGQSYFTAYSEYREWQHFMDYIKNEVLPEGSPLTSIYQTSEFWTSVIMEIIAVSSAIYSLLLSLLICIFTVATFTGHIGLLFITISSIIGMICLVVCIFYVVGWQMGAVEAVSLSILVGSSVDYCVHVVEGYLLAGHHVPQEIQHSNPKMRRWRTKVAISHIGVSICSSAITTIIAAIPLTQTVIQPFAKFGQIVTINTSVSILYTMTVVVAMLSFMAPARFVNSFRSGFIAFCSMLVVIGLFVLSLYVMSRAGINIPAPNGKDLFPN